MKSAFLLLLCLSSFTMYAQKKQLSLSVNAGPALTFHRPYNYDDGVDLIEVGKKKGPIGYSYAVDVKLEKKKITWGIQYNFREFKEKVSRRGYLGSFVNNVYYPQTHEYTIEGNLYHKQKALNLYIEKNLSRSDKSLVSLGVGPSFFWERNQYMGGQAATSPGSPFNVSTSDYTMYQAGEFGIYTFFSAERKFKNRYSLGIKLDLTYLITVDDLENMALMPYIKVDL